MPRWPRAVRSRAVRSLLRLRGCSRATMCPMPRSAERPLDISTCGFMRQPRSNRGTKVAPHPSGLERPRHAEPKGPVRNPFVRRRLWLCASLRWRGEKASGARFARSPARLAGVVGLGRASAPVCRSNCTLRGQIGTDRIARAHVQLVDECAATPPPLRLLRQSAAGHGRPFWSAASGRTRAGAARRHVERDDAFKPERGALREARNGRGRRRQRRAPRRPPPPPRRRRDAPERASAPNWPRGARRGAPPEGRRARAEEPVRDDSRRDDAKARELILRRSARQIVGRRAPPPSSTRPATACPRGQRRHTRRSATGRRR